MYPDIHEAMAMRIDQFTFGSIRIDGVIYDHDVVIARGRVASVAEFALAVAPLVHRLVT
jgi:hypothetical protein